MLLTKTGYSIKLELILEVTRPTTGMFLSLLSSNKKSTSLQFKKTTLSGFKLKVGLLYTLFFVIDRLENMPGRLHINFLENNSYLPLLSILEYNDSVATNKILPSIFIIEKKNENIFLMELINICNSLKQFFL
jgi:hypothetical protein